MKKILIIGAGFLQDFVIQKAKQMGYETLTVDADPHAIGFTHADKYKVINIINEKACLEYAQKEQIDGVLTAATDYGVLTAAYIAQEMGIPGIPYNVAKLIKNKYRVRKCLYEHHVDDTKQSYEIDSKTNIEKIKYDLPYPVIVKPCDGSGSRGTSRVDNPSNLDEACQYAMDDSITNKVIIEPFIIGKEYGAESLVINGKVYVLAIMKKWMTNLPYYSELGHAIPSGLDIDIEKKVIYCVKQAIKALGINFGSVNMDMIITDEGKIHIVDIGARMGGNMIGSCIVPYGTGIDYVGNMIRNAVGDEIDWNTKSHKAVASKLLAFKGGIVKKVPDFSKMMKEYGVEIYHHINIGDKVNEYHTNIDGCGYIISKREDVVEAEQVAAEVLEKIEQEIFG